MFVCVWQFFLPNGATTARVIRNIFIGCHLEQPLNFCLFALFFFIFRNFNEANILLIVIVDKQLLNWSHYSCQQYEEIKERASFQKMKLDIVLSLLLHTNLTRALFSALLPVDEYHTHTHTYTKRESGAEV